MNDKDIWPYPDPCPPYVPVMRELRQVDERIGVWRRFLTKRALRVFQRMDGELSWANDFESLHVNFKVDRWSARYPNEEQLQLDPVPMLHLSVTGHHWTLLAHFRV